MVVFFLTENFVAFIAYESLLDDNLPFRVTCYNIKLNLYLDIKDKLLDSLSSSTGRYFL